MPVAVRSTAPVSGSNTVAFAVTTAVCAFSAVGSCTISVARS
jgi:hypothetical protein